MWGAFYTNHIMHGILDIGNSRVAELVLKCAQLSFVCRAAKEKARAKASAKKAAAVKVQILARRE